MAEPFLAEIRMFSFSFPPKGWAPCNGQFLPINQNAGLFSLLGTTWGGNGQTTFALPDLRGRVGMGVGNGHDLGTTGGSPTVTVTILQLPSHTHTLNASTASAGSNPAGNALTQASIYASPANLTPLEPTTAGNAGGSQPHNNIQPFLVIDFCIALQGIFPTT